MTDARHSNLVNVTEASPLVSDPGGNEWDADRPSYEHADDMPGIDIVKTAQQKGSSQAILVEENRHKIDRRKARVSGNEGFTDGLPGAATVATFPVFQVPHGQAWYVERVVAKSNDALTPTFDLYETPSVTRIDDLDAVDTQLNGKRYASTYSDSGILIQESMMLVAVFAGLTGASVSRCTVMAQYHVLQV